MDGFGILFVVGIVLFVLFGPWLLLWRANSARRRERDEDQDRWGELTSRIYTLENAVESLRRQRSAAAAEEIKTKTLERPVTATVSPSDVTPAEVKAAPEPSPSVRVASDWVKQKTAEPAATHLPSAAPPPGSAPPMPASASVSPEPQPSFAAPEIHFSLTDRLKSSFDI